MVMVIPCFTTVTYTSITMPHSPFSMSHSPSWFFLLSSRRSPSHYCCSTVPSECPTIHYQWPSGQSQWSHNQPQCTLCQSQIFTVPSQCPFAPTQWFPILHIHHHPTRKHYCFLTRPPSHHDTPLTITVPHYRSAMNHCLKRITYCSINSSSLSHHNEPQSH